MTALPNIDPCPFCPRTPDKGDPATFECCPVTRMGSVVCDCNCAGPAVRTDMPEWQEKAIQAWNARSGPRPLRIADIPPPVNKRLWLFGNGQQRLGYVDHVGQWRHVWHGPMHHPPVAWLPLLPWMP